MCVCVSVCLTVCDLETSTMRRPRPELGFCGTEKSAKFGPICLMRSLKLFIPRFYLLLLATPNVVKLITVFIVIMLIVRNYFALYLRE